MAILSADYSNMNHEEMAAAIGLKPKHIPMLVGSFLEESVGIMEKLTEAINSKDYANIKTQAHAIKGSAGNLRFNEIYEMAKEMEFAAVDSDESFDYDGYLAAIKAAINTISS
jgi:HPt (histidine-containing phosphotransfer) domain-containing protein